MVQLLVVLQVLYMQDAGQQNMTAGGKYRHFLGKREQCYSWIRLGNTTLASSPRHLRQNEGKLDGEDYE